VVNFHTPTVPAEPGRTSEQLGVRTVAISLDPLRHFNRFAAVLADWGQHDLADVFSFPPWAAASTEQAELGIFSGGMPEPEVQIGLSKRYQTKLLRVDPAPEFDPDKSHTRVAKAPGLKDTESLR